ncbi:hypothetical protein JCM10908_007085 [Rhodotorula pacifica]|uniref:uncharacterized protein n=1 Tax=Rhodotorula pacifica TaxID=1495444 RepID=UPI003174AE8E
MARFGLDSDSDSDSQLSASSRSRSRSSSVASTSSSKHSNLPTDNEEAPPRHSLYDDQDDDEDADSAMASGDDDDDGDYSMTSSTRSRSRSLSLQPRGGGGPPRRLRQPPQRGAGTAPRWSTATAAATRPGRAAVMQASLFGPSPADEALLRQEQREEEEEQGEVISRRTKRADAQRYREAAQEKGKEPESDSPTQANTSQPTEKQRPLRPFALVPLADSCVNGHESSLVDASLALGRSYRVGFGPQGQIVSLRGAYRKPEEALQAGKLHVERLQLVPSPSSSSEGDKKNPKQDAIRLLELQLAKTDIYEPGSPDLPHSAVPQAVPSSSLRFHHFADLFRGDADRQQSSTAAEEEEARLFRLGACLFDEIADLALDEVDPASQPYVHAIRRRRLVSSWFEDAVSPAVEADLGALPAPSPSSPAASAKRIFALLSGHQIPAACDAALESSNLRLATVLAQIGPDALATDDAVRRDVALQLEKWREYHVDTFIDDAYREVLELVSGNLGISEGRQDLDPKGDSVKELHVLDGLGWKRALAAGAWYAVPQATGAEFGGADAGLAEVVERYEQAYRADERVAPPTPSYLLSALSSSSSLASSTAASLPWPPAPATTIPLDPAFHLLKLFTSPTHPLEAALEPRNFGPSPLDYRLPWHLYMLLSRVLRRRDWEDRLEVPDEEEDEDGDEAMRRAGGAAGGGEDEVVQIREGNSVTADRVTEAYAMQLEAQGEWHWAAFVLLHIELPDRRIKAIRELLARHAEELEQAAVEEEEADAGEEEGDEGAEVRHQASYGGSREKVEFVVKTLKVPEVWVFSARADYHLTSPSKLFRAYTLLLAAQRATEAHRIATEDLVPEALVRSDYSLVHRFLEPFLLESTSSTEPNLEGHVSGWNEGGKTYLLFLTQPDHPHLLPRAMQAVQALSKRVKESSRLKGKKLLRLAIAEMESRLTVLAKANTASKALERTQPSLLTASDRAVWIQGANQAFWQSAVGAAVGA